MASFPLSFMTKLGCEMHSHVLYKLATLHSQQKQLHTANFPQPLLASNLPSVAIISCSGLMEPSDGLCTDHPALPNQPYWWASLLTTGDLRVVSDFVYFVLYRHWLDALKKYNFLLLPNVGLPNGITILDSRHKCILFSIFFFCCLQRAVSYCASLKFGVCFYTILWVTQIWLTNLRILTHWQTWGS